MVREGACAVGRSILGLVALEGETMGLTGREPDGARGRLAIGDEGQKKIFVSVDVRKRA